MIFYIILTIIVFALSMLYKYRHSPVPPWVYKIENYLRGRKKEPPKPTHKELLNPWGSITAATTTVGGRDTPCEWNCPCKRGAPCDKIRTHRISRDVNGGNEIIHHCHECDQPAFTINNPSDPMSFSEHKCGCNHWGWLHMF